MNKLFSILLGAACAAHGGSLTHDGDTTNGALWQRPAENGLQAPAALSGLADAVRHEAMPVYVTVAGIYSFLSTTMPFQSWDNYALLYEGRFDPAQPLTGVLLANDDFGGVFGVAGFNYPLTADTQYYFVETGYANEDAGAFQLNINGPGLIVRGRIDNDDDGVPNAWETAHSTDPDIADAGDDPDQDGFTNRQEYEAGTHPNQAASHLRLAVVDEGGGRELTFLAAPNRYHRVWFQPAAGEAAWQTLDTFPPVPGQTPTEVRLPVTADGDARFFRLEAGLGNP